MSANDACKLLPRTIDSAIALEKSLIPPDIPLAIVSAILSNV
jgi:hypothetical protein